MSRQVLLTGVTGFIAKRIALDLLNAGHGVRGSLRSLSRADEVRDALRPHLVDPSALERLSFVALDLMSDDGWTEAATGVDAMMHTASPFPMSSPKDDDDLIRPAVDGTLRAMRAAQAAGVTRVILTSSVVAIEANDSPGPLTPDDWSDPDHPKSTAYYKSKTLAERAAWAFCDDHPEMQLTTVNPSLVLGAPLDANYGTSLALVERLMGGKDPMLPDLRFGVVDIADISAMHLAALDRPKTAGRRYIGSAGMLSMLDMAAQVACSYPDRKIPTRKAPLFMLRLLSLFDPAIKTILPQIGPRPAFDASATVRDLGISFTPVETAVERAAAAVAAR